MIRRADVAVCILAGGKATRLPGKLALDAGGIPMAVRVFRNVGAGHEAAFAVGSVAPTWDDAGAAFVIDRWPNSGPLGGLLSACTVLHAPWIFAVAGDAPFVTSALLDALRATAQPGDEALVPVHGEGASERREPLAALYDRRRALAAGEPLMTSHTRSMHALLDRLRVRTLRFEDDAAFC